MTQTFAAQMTAWSEKAKRNATLVVRAAAQDTFETMTERQPSVTETGGAFEVGKVPVKTGFLIGSQVAALNGAAVASGPIDYAAVVAGMDAGDTIEAGFTAPYARAVEYGHGAMPGRFFTREAVMGWQAAVDRAASKFKD